jgi:DNA-binding response OmpR family regulator
VTDKVVLIADDDRELVRALALRCDRLGLKTLCAYDAFSALSLIKSERPDMACLDVDMPAGNGLSVCEMLASDESCRTMPIAILTGRTDPETIMRCHSLCAYYVEKCSDVWSRIEPLLKELLCDSATMPTALAVHDPGPGVDHPLCG